jgi:hypothetical protein
MSGFKFDEDGFKRAVNGAMQDKTREVQRVIDRFARQHQGQSVVSIKPALRRMLEREGLKVPTAKLDEMAKAISEGGKVKFQYKAA